MQTYQYTTAVRVVETGELVVIEGLLTPKIVADNQGEALKQLEQWFITNKCVPHKKVT